MAGLLLLRDLEGELAFSADRVKSLLRGSQGVGNWDDAHPRYAFVCEFEYLDDHTIAYMLAHNYQVIHIEGMGVASLQLALYIQRCYGSEVHAIDDGCSFDIPLSTVSSLEDLEAKMEAGYGRENLEAR